MPNSDAENDVVPASTRSPPTPVGVRLAIGEVVLHGDLAVPERAAAIVVFAHGSGSSRHSPRNRFVAAALNRAGFATLLFDLLSEREDLTYATRFDIDLLADRLDAVVAWCRSDTRTRALPVGLFGASTGAAAALVVAARRREEVSAVVSRGGRPDLAGTRALSHVTAATLLIVGADDHQVIGLNRAAQQHMTGHAELEIVAGATHLFEEPGTLERVAELAAEWFQRWLVR